MTDGGVPLDGVLAAVAARAAEALATALGLGDDVQPFDEWPVEDGDAVLAAEVGGDVTGQLVLALNDAVARRLLQNADALTKALGQAAAVMGEDLGLAVEIGPAAASSGAAVPGAVAAVIDDGTMTALLGLSVVLPAPEPEPAADLAPGAAPFEPASFADEAPIGVAASGPLSLLGDVEMTVTAELGRTKMQMRDLLGLAPGMVVEIDRAAGAPIDLLVNGRRLATGEVVVIDEEFGIRITEIVPADEPAR